MEINKFQEAVRLDNKMLYLLSVKAIISGGLLELRDTPGKSVIIKGTLLKKLNEIVDEEICKIDQEIEDL